MSTVTQIEEAIARLSPQEFAELAEWFDRKRETEFDRRIETDAKSGRLDSIWEKEMKDIERGGARPLDELLDDQ